MEKQKRNTLDILYVILAIMALIANWTADIDSSYRIALLISFIILLLFIYYSKYFKISDKIELSLTSLEQRVNKMEDLINIKSDIKTIKNKLKLK